MSMIKGTTKSGFDFEVDEAYADDFELLELIGKLGTEPSVVAAILTRMLGEEQTKALKEYLRGDNGIIKASLMFEAVDDIINVFPKAKN